MTDQTIPAPESAPTLIPDPPEPAHIRAYRLGRALDSWDIVGDFIRGELRGDLADQLNRMAADERKRRLAFEARIEAKVDQLISMVAGQSDELLKYAQRVIAVEFKHREHEHSNTHCENADCEFRRLASELKAKDG